MTEFDDVELDERAYKEFIKLLNNGEANDAYRVFEKGPRLVDYLFMKLQMLIWIPKDTLEMKNLNYLD